MAQFRFMIWLISVFSFGFLLSYPDNIEMACQNQMTCHLAIDYSTGLSYRLLQRVRWCRDRQFYDLENEIIPHSHSSVSHSKTFNGLIPL